VRVLTRNTASARSKLQYPGLEFFAPAQWAEAVKGCDAVVNLAGTPIGTRCAVFKGGVAAVMMMMMTAVVAAVCACACVCGVASATTMGTLNVTPRATHQRQ
jgi:NAD dependent epimerase/dehydratase family enzyme